jgi:hypothetical protein
MLPPEASLDDDEGAHEAEDRPGGAEHLRVRRGEHDHADRSREPADQVERQEADAPEHRLEQAPEDPQRVHVQQDVEDQRRRVQEHRRERRHGSGMTSVMNTG